MENTKIRELEERIEVLEQKLQNLLVEKGNGIVFKNCSFNAVALEKCKNITNQGDNIENMVIMGMNCRLEENAIHNLECKSRNTRITCST